MKKRDGFLDGGLKHKYIIQKGDGSPTDPNADYFVLRIDEDPNARIALAAYARSVRERNLHLAVDLWEWLHATRIKFLRYRESVDGTLRIPDIYGP